MRSIVCLAGSGLILSAVTDAIGSMFPPPRTRVSLSWGFYQKEKQLSAPFT
jgi:hypothetical protein